MPLEVLVSERKDQKKPFDADVSPDNPANKEAAREHGLKYDRGERVYRDADGCPTRDRFGQPLG